jgi:hypothetical protein
MTVSTFTNILEDKDPTDVKEYGIDWTDVLTAEGETGIASSVWSPSAPAGLYPVGGSPGMGSPPVSYVEGLTSVIWLAGGTAGILYEMTNTIVTDSVTPRTHQRTIVIPCRNR